MSTIFAEGLEEADPRLVQALAEPVVDHHVHSVFDHPVDRAAFEAAINEASPAPIPSFMTQFDSQLGLAIRRWCAPLLGLDPHAEPAAYLERRSALGDAEVNARLLAAAGAERWLVDTGNAAGLEGRAGFSRLAGGPADEIVRLETLAEDVLEQGASPAEFAGACAARIAALRGRAAGTKTIAAYRTGLDIDWSYPDKGSVQRAAESVLARAAEEKRIRIAEPAIIAFLVNRALATGLPLQVHVGFGDRDLDLHRTDPMLMLPLLRRWADSGTAIALLHCYPFHRQAAYLAQAFDNVYFDVGLSINFAGALAATVISEAMELAPFAKQLYSSDASGLAELHVLGALLWRRGMLRHLSTLVRATDISVTDACRIARLIGAENARRVYQLPGGH
jgi:predicted TIM-barrel fold metal-dependent hydrolase